MAYDSPQGVKLTGLSAAADLSALQYTFVKLDASGNVVAASSQGEKCIGILQNKPANVGDACEIIAVGVSKGVADSALNEMVNVTTAADGQIDEGASADVVMGTTLTAATAAGDIISVMVSCATTAVLA